MKAVILLLLFVWLATASYSHAGNRDSISLRSVETLTFEAGKYTTGRRSTPMPQLMCTSNCQHTPSSVQCYNRGFDGRDVQWKCEADLPKGLELGKVSVSCEGYEYPNDPEVLVGSCGLEYELVGHKEYNHNHVNHPPQVSQVIVDERTITVVDDPTTLGEILFLFFVVLLLLVFVACLVNAPRYDGPTHTHWYYPSYWWGPSWGPSCHHTTYVATPPSRTTTTYISTPGSSTSNSGSSTEPNHTSTSYGSTKRR